jgi:hypothetical protein
MIASAAEIGEVGDRADRVDLYSAGWRMPWPMRRAHEPAASGAGRSARRSRARVSAETVKVAALNQSAGVTPQAATSAPRSGASAIWETTAADHRPLLAAASSCSLTMAGRTDAAAGLKNTAPAASRTR